MGAQDHFFNENSFPIQLIMLPLHGVIFPGGIVNIDLCGVVRNQVSSIYYKEDSFLAVINKESISGNKVGTIVRVKNIQIMDDKTIIAVKGVSRFRIRSIEHEKPYIVQFDVLETIDYENDDIQILYGMLLEIFERFVKIKGINPIKDFSNISQRVDYISGCVSMSIEKKQEILETLDLKERLEIVIDVIENEIDDIKKELSSNVVDVLKERKEEIQDPVKEYEDKLNSLALSGVAREITNKELNRLSRMNPAGSEAEVVRTYLDCVISLPWGIYTEDNPSIIEARRMLQEDHYGLDAIKENIIENLSVKLMNPDAHGAILCFSGPPGVGKTSMGKSIARALGRKFYRLSLGGVRDEAEIRGHRRTYIGALPGNIIQGIQAAGSNNPVFMLDEIDKLGNDHKGDPSSALLEALDPEQNNNFGDHYLGFPFDLSKVLFITTANDLYAIPGPLRDRMEVIELPGYTQEEKVHIAEKHLIPRQIRVKGLQGKKIKFTKKAIETIIVDHTVEAGVRMLEQRIGKVCRKIVVQVLEKKLDIFQVDKDDIEKYLGRSNFRRQRLTNLIPGVIAGLAWTVAGGKILYVEALAIEKDTPSLAITGNLQKVMEESFSVAYKFVQAHMGGLCIENKEFFKKNEINIHVPEGAVLKDGPSAGITVLTALVSLARCKAIKNDIAMTGEITLRGDILPVGGVKEKVLAAYREGIKCIILSSYNKKDVEDIGEEIRNEINFKYCDSMIEAVNFALED